MIFGLRWYPSQLISLSPSLSLSLCFILSISFSASAASALVTCIAVHLCTRARISHAETGKESRLTKKVECKRVLLRSNILVRLRAWNFSATRKSRSCKIRGETYGVTLFVETFIAEIYNATIKDIRRKENFVRQRSWYLNWVARRKQ